MDNRTKVNREWSMLVAHHRHYHHCVSVWIIVIMALSMTRTNLSIERYCLLRLQPNLLATDSTLTPITLFWDISQTNYPNTKSVCSPHYCWEKYVAFQNLFLFKTFNDCASICSVLLLNGAAIPLNQLPHETRMTSKSDQEVRFQVTDVFCAPVDRSQLFGSKVSSVLRKLDWYHYMWDCCSILSTLGSSSNVCERKKKHWVRKNIKF